MGLLERLQELEAMRKNGQISDSEYEMLVASAAKSHSADLPSAQTRASDGTISTGSDEASKPKFSAKLTPERDGNVAVAKGKNKLGLIIVMAAVIAALVFCASRQTGNEKNSPSTKASSFENPVDGSTPFSTEEWENITIKDMNYPRPDNGTSNHFWAFEIAATYRGSEKGNLRNSIDGVVSQDGVSYRWLYSEENYEPNNFGGIGIYSQEVIAGASSKVYLWYEVAASVTSLVFQIVDKGGETWIKPGGSLQPSPSTTESAAEKLKPIAEIHSLDITWWGNAMKFGRYQNELIQFFREGKIDVQTVIERHKNLVRTFSNETDSFCAKVQSKKSELASAEISLGIAINGLEIPCTGYTSFLQLLDKNSGNDYIKEWNKFRDGTTSLTFIERAKELRIAIDERLTSGISQDTARRDYPILTFQPLESS